MSKHTSKDAVRRIAGLLPDKLRNLVRLATVNRRVAHLIANQEKLVTQLRHQSEQLKAQGEQLKAQGEQLKAQGEQLKAQGEQLRVQSERMAEVRGAINQQNERLARAEQKLEILVKYLPQLRAMKAPMGRNDLAPEEVWQEISKIENWYHSIQVAPGIFTPGTQNSDMALEAMEVPDRLDGKRVLDIGARDGYFSFVAEARGAEVLAIDAVAPHLTGFDTAASLLSSSVEYRTMNVYDVSPEVVGTFDVIFFLGVLYHLRDPMLALDRLWSVAKPGSTVWVESHVIDYGLIDPESGEWRNLAAVAPDLVDIPIAQFYPGDLLANSVTNWWGPNLAGLEAMVEAAGFEVERSRFVGGRGLVVGRKVEDEETNFYREFDRGTATGEEGMAWHSARQWHTMQSSRKSATPLSSENGATPEEVREEILKVENWYHRIEVAPGVVTPGVHDSEAALEAMEVPERLDGKRVLDVGARDGYFSFVAEARGAEVLAIDAVDLEHLMGFAVASKLLNSSVEYRTMNVYDVSPEVVGTFDAIFFLGVLYHLRDPMLALDRLWAVAKPGSAIWVESHTIDHSFIDPESGEQKPFASVAPELAEVPMAQFYPKDLLGGNFTNWWGPNLAGLEAMVEAAGFKIERSRLIGGRGLVVGRKIEDEETDFYRWYDRGTVTEKKDQRA